MADTNTQQEPRAPDDSDTNETKQGKKKRNAFALYNFDENKILQRPFFSKKRFVDELLKGTPFENNKNELSDEALFELCCNRDAYDAYEYEVFYKNLKIFLNDLWLYYGKIKEHVIKLKNFSAILADKILLSDEGNQSKRKQYRRTKDLICRYEEITRDIVHLATLVETIRGGVDSRLCDRYRDIFATRLKQAREGKHLTQAKIAAELDISDSAYLYYEKGRREPSLATLIRLAKILDVTPNWLLGFK